MVVLAWFGLWYLTPGLTKFGIGSLLAADWSVVVLVESGIVVALVAALSVLQRRRTARVFAPSWWMLAYIAPLALAVALPFHYELPLPVAIYMFWMAASVLWQDYITFGLLQDHVGDWLRPVGTVLAVAVVYYLGHAIFIPDTFAPTYPFAAGGILALGIVFATLRQQTATVHLILALHLSFYYALA